MSGPVQLGCRTGAPRLHPKRTRIPTLGTHPGSMHDDDHASADPATDLGRAARRIVPRSSVADWRPPPDRADPVTTLAQQEEPFLGMLRSYTFRRPEHARNVEAGPRLLALSEVATHRLPACVAQRTAEWLLGRPTGEADADWLDTLARQFVAGGYHYRDLVAAIVTSDRYLRVR